MALNKLGQTTVIPIPPTTVDQVEALVWGGDRWNTKQAGFTGTVVHWAVDTSWAPSQTRAIEDAFKAWSNVAAITFLQVFDVADAELVLHQVPLTKKAPSGAPASFQPPSEVANPLEGALGTVPDYGQAHGYFARDGIFATAAKNPNAPSGERTDAFGNKAAGISMFDDNGQITRGGFSVLVHELGHALGLKHPHTAEPGIVNFPGVENDNHADLGTNQLNQTINTVMSYISPSLKTAEGDITLITMTTPMAYDIAAIQLLYGAMRANSGNDIYRLTDPKPLPTASSIWDTGIDEIAYDGTAHAVIDLRSATLDGSAGSGGGVSYTYVDNPNGTKTLGHSYTIAGDILGLLPDNGSERGVVIENATGGSNGDVIFGNGAANVLNGRGGNDRLVGGTNNDLYYLFDVTNDEYDTVVEKAGEGLDTVYVRPASAKIQSYTLAPNVEDGVIYDPSAFFFTLNGNGENNRLYDDAGWNILSGATGDDELNGGGGYDTLIGGGDNDTYYLEDVTLSRYDNVVEAAGGGRDIVYLKAVDPTFNKYTLTANVEDGSIYDSSANGFTLTGNGENNKLYDEDGSNTLSGEGGNDELHGGAGLDFLRGGADNDKYYLQDRSTNGWFDLVGEDWNNGTDTVYVTAIADPSYYSEYRLTSNVENGVIEGTLSFDLIGNGLNNTLTGNSSSNTLTGGDGDDTLQGRGGIDTAAFSGLHNQYEITRLSDTSIRLRDTRNNSPDGTDTAIDVEHFKFADGTFSFNDLIVTTPTKKMAGTPNQDNLQGTASGELIQGFGDHDRLDGGGGNDILEGGAGNDVLIGGAGTDTLQGGVGDDTLIADNLDIITGGAGFDTVNADVSTAAAGFIFSFAGTDIESVNGSAGNDRIDATGVTTSVTLFGLAGNDILIGGTQGDTLDGGAGIDTLYGGAGNDIYIVDNAADVVKETTRIGQTFIDAGGIDEVRATSYSYVLPEYVSGGIVEDLTYTGIGSFTGTGNSFNNIIKGGAGKDTLIGGAGNDTIQGGGDADNLFGGFRSRAEAKGFDGDDTIFGDAGNDTITVLWGNDTVFGGADNDTLAFTEVTANLTLNLASGQTTYSAGSSTFDSEGNVSGGFAGLYTVTWHGIENLTGGLGKDTITGDGNANTLSGGAGMDTLVGGGGNDTLIGGTDADTFRFATGFGHDTVKDFELGKDVLDMTGVSGLFSKGQLVMTSTAQGVKIGFGAESVTLNNVTAAQLTDASFKFTTNPNITGTAASETLTGTDVVNVIKGMGGNDTLIGKRGGDTLDGGEGTDTADYSASMAAININFINGTGQGGDAYGDTLVSIERVVGSAFADQMIGSSKAETLEGGAGDDILYGGGGADTILGGEGNDTLSFNNLVARVDGGAGWDGLTADESTDATGINFKVLGTSIEYVGGRYGNDTVDARGLDYGITFNGFGGNDTFYGSEQTDVLWGEEGTDKFIFSGKSTDYSISQYGGDGNSWLITNKATEVWDAIYYVETLQFTDKTVDTNLFSRAVYGADTSDVFTGFAGVDAIEGGGGADTINGVGGADILDGGFGADRLTGGANNDTFVFRKGQANGDVITDFAGNGADAGDQLKFIGYGAGASIHQVGTTNQWQIDYANNTLHETITLSNNAMLHSSDYLLV